MCESHESRVHTKHTIVQFRNSMYNVQWMNYVFLLHTDVILFSNCLFISLLIAHSWTHFHSLVYRYPFLILCVLKVNATIFHSTLLIFPQNMFKWEMAALSTQLSTEQWIHNVHRVLMVFHLGKFPYNCVLNLCCF